MSRTSVLAIGPNEHYDLDVLRDLRANKGDDGTTVQKIVHSPLFAVALDGYLAVNPHAKDLQRKNMNARRDRAYSARMRRIAKQKGLE